MYSLHISQVQYCHRAVFVSNPTGLMCCVGIDCLKGIIDTL